MSNHVTNHASNEPLPGYAQNQVCDGSGLPSKPLPNAPPRFLIRAAFWLRRMLLRLADRLIPGEAILYERCTGIGQTQVIGFIARHKIADLLLDGPLTAGEVARHTDCNEDAMHRLLRAAVTSGLFRMDDNNRFAHNRLSLALCSGRTGRAKEFAEYFSSASNCRAYLEMDTILRRGESGFDRANQSGLWAWFDAHPRERHVFAEMMMGVTMGEAPMIARLYPFETVERLCDVGGGRGVLLSELLQRFPGMQGVLFDCQGVIESATPLLKARGVADRVTTVAGDFNQSLVPGCDAYLLKNVLHDWDDQRCQVILDNCRRVMAVGARILIVEIIVEKNDRHNFGSYRDIHVMTVCAGGRERGRREYQHLLQACGFRMNRVFDSPIISVIEGVAV